MRQGEYDNGSASERPPGGRTLDHLENYLRARPCNRAGKISKNTGRLGWNISPMEDRCEGQILARKSNRRILA